MSSDVDDEQVLPESLQKLEIVPDCSHSTIKCNITNKYNPFYTVPTANITCTDNNQNIDELFGPSCINCGNNDKLNDNKDNNKTSRQSAYSTIEHGVLRHIHFKQRDKYKGPILNEKKISFLREPILKSIGRSIHHSHSRQSTSKSINCQNKFTNRSSSSSTEPICSDDQLPNLYNSNSNNISNLIIIHRNDNKQQNWKHKTNLSIDFKSLINECNDNVSSINFDKCGDGRLFNRHRTKTFHTLDSPNEISNVNNELAALAIAGTSGNSSSMNTSVSSNSSTSSSSSCSQQARMNSTNCDVTIDELASYFETFVHIPKKMSSMAEMMYI